MKKGRKALSIIYVSGVQKILIPIYRPNCYCTKILSQFAQITEPNTHQTNCCINSLRKTETSSLQNLPTKFAKKCTFSPFFFICHCRFSLSLFAGSLCTKKGTGSLIESLDMKILLLPKKRSLFSFSCPNGPAVPAKALGQGATFGQIEGISFLVWFGT